VVVSIGSASTAPSLGQFVPNSRGMPAPRLSQWATKQKTPGVRPKFGACYHERGCHFPTSQSYLRHFVTLRRGRAPFRLIY